MWTLAGKTFKSRLILGTAKYPSPEILARAIEGSQAEIVTVSLRRLSLQNRSQNRSDNHFVDFLRTCNVVLLPNTAGCRSAHEAVTTARLAREVFGTNWIKLETVGDEYTLQPDPFELLKAARILLSEGFEVFPYTTDDLVIADRLVSAGCKILMPWAAPIGSGQGLLNPTALKQLRMRFPQTTLIVDAGLGAPSHAARVMELGFDGVLLNSAVSLAIDPISMAKAFGLAVNAGRLGYKSGMIAPREFASASTPILGTPFRKEVNEDSSPAPPTR